MEELQTNVQDSSIFYQMAQSGSSDKSQSSWSYPNLTPPNRDKKQYALGPSLLDQCNPESELSRSSLIGFYKMAIIFALVFLFTKPVLNKLQNGYFLEPYLYTTFKQDYFLCVLIWPLFFLWSFTSFFLQKLILRGISEPLILIYQHSTQAGLFIFSSYMILQYNWCSTHAAFVILQACVHFMKMHSYTTVNRDYRDYVKQMEGRLRPEEGKQKNVKTSSSLPKNIKRQSSKGKRQEELMTEYPRNINLKDFLMFMLTPWLVYDKYPRKTSISMMYIIKKSAYGMTSILMCYIIHTEYLLPPIEQGSQITIIELVLRQMLPSTIILVIMFFLTFEFITNIFAEITRLDHRKFYEDWWNSTTYEEFNRKWNKPVHLFLYRHVYLEALVRWKTSKPQAQFITFLFSALLHEFLLAMIFRIIRPIFLGFIIFQVPLIYLTKWMSGTKSGGYLFWLGLILGPSLIVSFYLRSHDSVTNFFTRQ